MSINPIVMEFRMPQIKKHVLNFFVLLLVILRRSIMLRATVNSVQHNIMSRDTRVYHEYWKTVRKLMTRILRVRTPLVRKRVLNKTKPERVTINTGRGRAGFVLIRANWKNGTIQRVNERVSHFCRNFHVESFSS